MPLLLGFRFGNPNKKRVGLQIGAIGAYKIGSRIKQKYFLPENDTKQKIGQRNSNSVSNTKNVSMLSKHNVLNDVIVEEQEYTQFSNESSRESVGKTPQFP